MKCSYARYLLRHKWFVFLECCKLGIPIRGITHDWSKFFPDEFIAYYQHFKDGVQTGRDKTGYYKPEDTNDPAFEVAWLRHSNRNSHHWQYWCMPTKSGVHVYEMPLAVRKEMLADWRGAGRAQGTPGTKVWYLANRDKITLGPKTRRWIEDELGLNTPEDCTNAWKGDYNSH